MTVEVREETVRSVVLEVSHTAVVVVVEVVVVLKSANFL